MYAGEDVGAIVIDHGTSLVKAGYAGEDVPKYIFPSAVGVIESSGSEAGASKERNVLGSSQLLHRRDNMEIVRPVENGLIANWDAAEQCWDYALQKYMQAKPREHPLLMSEAVHTTREQREKTCEIVFEKFGVPAFYMAKTPVLTSFACGRGTSLVVDIGASYTFVAPVQDGSVLNNNIARSPLAGNAVSRYISDLLKTKSVNLRPGYEIKKTEGANGQIEVSYRDFPHTKASYRQFLVDQLIEDIKASVCSVAPTRADMGDQSAGAISPVYELPDGTRIELGGDGRVGPELLFNPSIIKPAEGENTEESLAKRIRVDPSMDSIPHLIHAVIQSCHVDIRKELWGNIILCGGGSLLRGLPERLTHELEFNFKPSQTKVKVISSTIPEERRFASWIGGSILASLGTFHQLWLSKEEFAEHGKAFIHQKCP